VKARTLLGAFALVALTALVTYSVAQDPKMDPKMEEMMQKMMELGTPGAEHQKMATKAGKWDLELLAWEPGKSEPSKSKGTSEIKSIMDGRYLVEHVDSSFDMGGMQMPFQGMGILGYDNFKKKYVSTWLDSMSTAIMTMEGTMSGKTCTMEGMGVCCYSNQLEKMRFVSTDIDKDNFKFEMFGPGPDGKETKGLEIHYKRNGGKNAQ
jgi:hypothetical protein